VASTTPRVITKSDPTRVVIEWDDGHRTTFSASQLRKLCPCARCVDEITGRAILDPTSVPQAMTHTDVRLVGNYAISLRFADGHDTGIFPFVMLRERDPGPPRV